jgi:kynurenine formamidase
MSREALERQAARLSNWGRWGERDELGTVNFIDRDKVLQATTLVRRGDIFPLGVAVDRDGPQLGRRRRGNPTHFMTDLPRDNVRPDGSGTSDDTVLLPTQSGTQWDGLAHKSYRGLMYNGRSHDLVTAAGAQANSVRAVSGRIMTRGVLVDLPRLRGVDALDPGEEVTAKHLERALDAQGAGLAAGDILLVHTGHLARCRARSWEGFYGAAPGLGIDTLDWIYARQLAGVATDTGATEVRPSRVPGVDSPFHVIALVYMGLLIGEIFDLHDLAAACAADASYDFLLVAPGLPISGGVASPVNPYAVR